MFRIYIISAPDVYDPQKISPSFESVTIKPCKRDNSTWLINLYIWHKDNESNRDINNIINVIYVSDLQ